MKRLDTIRIAGRVKRYHTTDTVRVQNVADHSWNVAQILLHVDPNCNRELLIAALHHDIPEYFTGDVPAPAKWASPSLTTDLAMLENEVEVELDICTFLRANEKALLKFADSLECLMWCVEEMQMGNMRIKYIYDRLVLWFEQNPPSTPVCRELLKTTLRKLPVV